MKKILLLSLLLICSKTYPQLSGNYITTKEHPKAKGVNLEIKAPIGWKVEEGNRPNVVKKFIMGDNSYIILIKDNYTFFSRKEAKKLLSDEKFMNEFVKQIDANYFQSSKIANKKIVTVGTYPALELIIQENKEHTGFIFNMTMINWIIFFEDKIIILQGGGLSNDFERLLPTFYSITNSVIFPEQYEK